MNNKKRIVFRIIVVRLKPTLPILYESLWTDDLIIERRTLTDGKIIVIGRKAKRKKAKRFDFLLR